MRLSFRFDYVSFSLCFYCMLLLAAFFFFFSSRRRHTRFDCDWSSDVCSSDLRQARDGFWFAGAFGAGWAHVSCDICQGTNRGGFSGALRLGGAVSHAVLIGAGVGGWGATIEMGADPGPPSLAAFGATADPDPSPRP